MKMQKYVGSKLKDPVLLRVFVIVPEDGSPCLSVFYFFQNIHLINYLATDFPEESILDVIDLKIPLSQPSPSRGEGQKFPSLEGRYLREGDIFMLLCEQ